MFFPQALVSAVQQYQSIEFKMVIVTIIAYWWLWFQGYWKKKCAIVHLQLSESFQTRLKEAHEQYATESLTEVSMAWDCDALQQDFTNDHHHIIAFACQCQCQS